MAPRKTGKGPSRRARASHSSDELSAALDAIRRIVQALRISTRAAERRLGISGAQLFVLHALSETPADSLNELAARTFTHQSSVSTVVERLVRKRYVSRTRSSADARRVVLSITPSGRALLRSSPDIAQLRLINALRDLAPRDRRSLVRTLDNIVHEMGADAAPALFFEEGERRRKTKTKRKQRAESRKQ
jgi:DNA-binding MarR family transcriptional regulator